MGFSHVRFFVTPWTATHQASLSIVNSRSLLELMSTKLMRPSNHLILYLSPSPPAFNLPSIRVFSSESVLHIRWPKYWSFSFSISLSNEYSGLISFRIDWFVIPAVCPRNSQESSLAPQFKSISSSALSLLYGPALTAIHDYWKNHSFDYMDHIWQGDVSAFFLIYCLDLSKFFFQGASVLISLLQFTVCSDFEAQEKKICYCFHFFPIYLP